MQLADFINPVPEAVYPVWPAGHFWSGREPSTPPPWDPAVSRRPHLGLDLKAPSRTRIQSPAPGRILHAGWLNAGAGNAVHVLHLVLIGTRTRYLISRHLHCHADFPVVEDQVVRQGQTIGYVGATGATAGPTAYHDHTELVLGITVTLDWRTWKHLDPEPVYYPGGYENMRIGHPWPEDVAALQRRLNRIGYTPPLDVDGSYGPKTAEGVKWYQELAGIHASGEACPLTLALLMPRFKPPVLTPRS